MNNDTFLIINENVVFVGSQKECEKKIKGLLPFIVSGATIETYDEFLEFFEFKDGVFRNTEDLSCKRWKHMYNLELVTDVRYADNSLYVSEEDIFKAKDRHEKAVNQEHRDRIRLKMMKNFEK